MKNKMLCLFILIAFVSFNVSFAQITSVADGNWSAAGTWVGGVVPTSTDNVVISTGTTVTVDVDFTIINLSISGTLFTKTDGVVNMVVNGDMIVNSGGSFLVQTNSISTALVHTLDLKSNLTHSGIGFDCRTGSTSGPTLSVINVRFSGSTNSTVTMNGTFSNSNGEFNYITINKTGGAKVILGSNIITSGGSSTVPAANSGITFINGIVETGDYFLAYQGSTGGQVSGYSTSSYVNGSFARGMGNTTASSKDFPVGDANGYRIFYLRCTTAGSATGHLAIVKCLPGNANTGSSVLSSDIDKVSGVRYYQVSYSNALGGAANMSFDLFKVSYDTDDGVLDGNTDLRVAYSTDSRANWTGITQTTPHTTLNPSQIEPDPITPAALSSGSSMFVSLANATGGVNSIPVELTSYTVSNLDDKIILEWTTSTELNNDGFEIERKFENDEFEKIGFVKGFGSTTERKNYRFEDNFSISGNVSYRLKQVDFDGTFNYSNTIEIIINAVNQFELVQNYPNPFNPVTFIKYEIPQDNRVFLTIYNITGSEVATLINEHKSAGSHIVEFNASNLPSGVYIYKLQAGNYSAVKKLTLLK
jgi:hypothetical protein